jgi:predicted dehydrogenase
MRKLTRRQFLGHTAAAGAGMAIPYFVPGSVLGADGGVPASEKIVMGFIGVGGMGNGHLGSFLGQDDVQVVAVCDVDEQRRNERQARVGEGCAAYNDYRELLERTDIDAVCIATPDHWHALTSIHACESGKDVYCEKPLTLTVREGREIVNAVRRYGRVFQVGSQQRSAREFRFGCELVRSGYIGELETIRVGIGGGPVGGNDPDTDPPPELDWNMWLGPAPWRPYNRSRCHYTFRWFWDYSGGKMTDWGAHHNDIAQWGNGASHTGPISVEGTAEFPNSGLFETCSKFEVKYKYANGVELNTASGNPGGCRFEGTEGWVHTNRGKLETEPAELKQLTLGPDDVHLYNSGNHRRNWLECIKTRERPICDVEIGHRSVTVCHIGNIALRIGRPLQWDPETEQFVNDEAANRWLDRPYRAPWHL